MYSSKQILHDVGFDLFRDELSQNFLFVEIMALDFLKLLFRVLPSSYFLACLQLTTSLHMRTSSRHVDFNARNLTEECLFLNTWDRVLELADPNVFSVFEYEYM